MKKRVLIALAVLVCITIIAVFIFSGIGLSSHTGLYLRADNGSHLVIMDNSPIVMSDRADNDMFANLTDGDRILFVHDGIQESYPGGTLVYMCLKLSDGDITDIPETVLTSLSELGWIEYEKNS